MDRDPHQPLTPPVRLPLTTEEAKLRLRMAAQNVTLGALIGKHTWPFLAAAVAGGFVAARVPKLLSLVVIKRAAPILLGVLLGRKRSHSASSEDSSLKSK